MVILPLAKRVREFTPVLYRCLSIVACCVVLLLQGCAIQTQPSAPSGVLTSPQAIHAAWLRHKMQMETITKWRLVGRAGVRTTGRSGSVGVNWQQLNQHYSLTFSGPFGEVLGRLSGSMTGDSTLLLPGHRPVKAASGEALVASITGWDIPVNALRYWILGIPVPGKNNAGRVWINAQGRLERLSQFGWQITYSDYVLANHYVLPSRMRLVGQKVDITLIVNWRQVNVLQSGG